MRFAIRYAAWSVVGVVLLLASPAGAQRPDEPLVDKVKKSIDRGVQFLRDQEGGRGHWEVNVEGQGYRGGWTSMALLALMNCGVPPEDPIIKRGLAYLRGIPPHQTYVVGLQTMAFAMAGQGVDRERIQRNVDWLLAARMRDGWTYAKTLQQVGGDNSNTQYALLGLHEGLQSGAKVPPAVLEEIRSFYIRAQQRGAWGYRGVGGGTLTMTTAGLCGLVITGMDLAIGQQKLRPDGSADNCGFYAENEPVAQAIQWIAQRHPAKIGPGNIDVLGSPFYCLYGIERAGRLTGNRFFGEHDWYRVGCEWLVELQQGDGSWGGAGLARRQIDAWPVVATSFSLLFLSKGRTPVLLTKLAHNEGDDWNTKRNAPRHVVEFASRELFKKMPLAWQVFDVRRLPAETRESRRDLAADLLQSPIVFVSGHNLAPRNKEEEILQEYLNNGGFLFAEACCGRANFDRDFRELMKRLFPDNELKPLPPEHPIWTASGKFGVRPDIFRLEGIQQGCKTVVVYSPQALSGYWESNQFQEGRGRTAFQLAANVIAYATGLEPPKPRLTEVEIDRTANKREEIKRGYLKVAQLRHEGDWQPAPKAMRNLMLAGRNAGLDVLLETKPLYPQSENVLDFRFFYLHGRNSFSFKKDDLKHLRFVLENGGVLLADACCGSKSFDAAFRKLMEEMWADRKLKLEPIPLADDLYSAELNGTAITRVKCRREPPEGGRAGPGHAELPPALEGVKVNGRWAVIYSRYDIGCALEKHASTDCLGHDHDSALRLGQAAVLYALKR